MTNNPQAESSPVPSVTNYPENNNPNWFVGFENDGEKVKTPPSSKDISLTGAVTGTGFIGSPINTIFSYPLNAGNNRIVSIAEPINAQDAATKNYVDTQGGGTPSKIQDTTTFNGNPNVMLKYGAQVGSKGPGIGRNATFLSWNGGGDVGYIAVWEDGCQIINSADTWSHIIRFVDEDVKDPNTGGYSAAIDSAGNYITNSSEKEKCNISLIKENSLNKLNLLEVKTYGFKSKKYKIKNENSMGIIVEEAKKVFPDIVENHSAINLTRLQMHMLKAIQELSKEVQQLKKEK